MPYLGEYAVYVLSAYAATILILAVLIGASVLSARKARAELDRVEEEQGRA